MAPLIRTAVLALSVPLSLGFRPPRADTRIARSWRATPPESPPPEQPSPEEPSLWSRARAELASTQIASQLASTRLPAPAVAVLQPLLIPIAVPLVPARWFLGTGQGPPCVRSGALLLAGAAALAEGDVPFAFCLATAGPLVMLLRLPEWAAVPLLALIAAIS